MSNFIVEHDFTRPNGLREVTIMIDRPFSHHRCGYVGVDRKHPLFGLNYSDPMPGKTRADLENMPFGDRGVLSLFGAALDNKQTVSIDLWFDVHGSLTFAGSGAGSNGHNGYPVTDPDRWFFGFDCAHCDDTLERWTREAVIAETTRLGDQLAKEAYA